jgi:AcrR family transcriptional regulator
MSRKSTSIRKKQILEASRGIIVKYGSENVTIRRIAKEVGITEGAIYRHFKSKKEVLFGMADFAINSLLDDISIIDSSVDDKLEVVSLTLSRHISEIEQRKGSSFQVIAEIISFGDRKLNKKVYEGLNQYIEKLKDLLRVYAKSNKNFNSKDIDSASFMLFGMIQGLVSIWALSNYDFDMKQKYLRMWDIFRRDILSR